MYSAHIFPQRTLVVFEKFAQRTAGTYRRSGTVHGIEILGTSAETQRRFFCLVIYTFILQKMYLESDLLAQYPVPGAQGRCIRGTCWSSTARNCHFCLTLDRPLHWLSSERFSEPEQYQHHAETPEITWISELVRSQDLKLVISHELPEGNHQCFIDRGKLRLRRENAIVVVGVAFRERQEQGKKTKTKRNNKTR